MFFVVINDFLDKNAVFSVGLFLLYLLYEILVLARIGYVYWNLYMVALF